MKSSLTDQLATVSAALDSLTAALATMGVLSLGAVGAVKVAAGHARVQNPHWRKFLAITIFSAAITATLQINGLTLA